MERINLTSEETFCGNTLHRCRNHTLLVRPPGGLGAEKVGVCINRMHTLLHDVSPPMNQATPLPDPLNRR
ncbi:MAG: hypothetical protein IPL78_36120 [Chloroflexi bacterium]|nr:hypothetical protein [Chloroflexota bacterium]